MTLTNKIKQLVAAGILGAASLAFTSCQSANQQPTTVQQPTQPWECQTIPHSQTQPAVKKYNLIVPTTFTFQNEADVQKFFAVYNITNSEDAIAALQRVSQGKTITKDMILADLAQQNELLGGHNFAKTLYESLSTSTLPTGYAQDRNVVSTRTPVEFTGENTGELLEALLRAPNTNKFDAENASEFILHYLKMKKQGNVNLDSPQSVLIFTNGYMTRPFASEAELNDIRKPIDMTFDFDFDSAADMEKLVAFIYAKEKQGKENYQLTSVDLARHLFSIKHNDGHISTSTIKEDFVKPLVASKIKGDDKAQASAIDTLYNAMAPQRQTIGGVTYGQKTLSVALPLYCLTPEEKLLAYTVIQNSDGTIDQSRAQALLGGFPKENYTQNGVAYANTLALDTALNKAFKRDQ